MKNGFDKEFMVKVKDVKFRLLIRLTADEEFRVTFNVEELETSLFKLYWEFNITGGALPDMNEYSWKGDCV